MLTGGTTTILGQTIDSDSNTITNIVNADIKSNNAIALSKLAEELQIERLKQVVLVHYKQVQSRLLNYVLDGGTSLHQPHLQMLTE